MAKQIQEILIDDLDGGEANETVSFAIDGSSYEIDLSDLNAKKLRDALTVQVRVELVPWGSLSRSEYKSKLVER